jgi:hypothetical protein
LDAAQGFESTYESGHTRDVPLGEFLKRPVEIHTISPSLGSQQDVAIDPWLLFLNNSQVQDKIRGYKHLRGTLCLRFMITGNPFLSGRFMYFYIPRPNDNIVDLASPFGDARLIQASQHMNVMLDPTTGEGASLRLPFFCPENWLDLTSTNSIIRMGRLRFFVPSPLKSANSASATCVIRVHAWMEDAELAAPTTSAFTAGWTPQAEFSTPPVSRIAGHVAKAAGMFSNLPLIEPYAMATERAASAVGRIAHLFGMSRPQVLDKITPYRSFEMGEFAVTNKDEATMRLGLDAKGELSIDPRTVGLAPIDEMSFDHILQKENIFKRQAWATSDVSGASLLTIKVTPCQFGTDTTTVNDRSALTSQAAIASLFHYWKGTIIYRFRIVASSLHRGKLRIVYDPIGSTASDFNQTYSRIVDLEETRDFEIPIAWHAMESFLKVRHPEVGTVNFNHGASVSHFPSFENGSLRIEVLNPLVTPDPSLATGCEILISQRMTDDYEFGCPSNHIFTNTWKFYSSAAEGMQAGDILDASDGPDSPESAAEHVTPVGTTSEPMSDSTLKVFMGESPRSIRTLMRRYGNYYISPSTINVQTNCRGSKTDDLCVQEYCTWMFAGWRGSRRYKSITSTNGQIMFGHWAPDAAVISHALSTSSGVAANRNTLEMEVPFYSNKRFAPARGHTGWSQYTASIYDSLDPNNATVRFSTPAATTHYAYRAVGEDFALFWHLGLPLVYQG